jgi:hypothetical protein
VEEFRYSETNLKNQNSIPEDIKSRLKSRNDCYHLVRNLLSSASFSKNLKIKIYRIIILSVVLYGCETWLLTLREKCRLRDAVIGEWRKLHNGELNDMHSSTNIVRVIKSRMRWVGHVARMGQRIGTYGVLVGKPEGKRPFGRPKRRWEDNIKMIFRKCDVEVWAGSSWLGIGTGGGYL